MYFKYQVMIRNNVGYQSEVSAKPKKKMYKLGYFTSKIATGDGIIGGSLEFHFFFNQVRET